MQLPLDTGENMYIKLQVICISAIVLGFVWQGEDIGNVLFFAGLIGGVANNIYFVLIKKKNISDI